VSSSFVNNGLSSRVVLYVWELPIRLSFYFPAGNDRESRVETYPPSTILSPPLLTQARGLRVYLMKYMYAVGSTAAVLSSFHVNPIATIHLPKKNNSCVRLCGACLRSTPCFAFLFFLPLVINPDSKLARLRILDLIYDRTARK
jgi:hypothetical protein